MTKDKILSSVLGIELGSTRIKACLTDDTYTPVASGVFEWENKFENGYWTYSEEEIHDGIKECYSSLRENVKKEYGVDLTRVKAIGISGMMHGYLAFDKDYKLLTPFRTWRNTTTEKAADALTELFGFNIPQRWSVAHLYQAILNGEEHVGKIAHITTLAGYIHYMLTGRWEVGICEASGMFPVNDGDYNKEMLDKFNALIKERDFSWKIEDILPEVKMCGESGAYLTKEGANFIDTSGMLSDNIPVCPPEGDAGTGMVATNSVKPKTGNVSAGTSVFSMLVLDKPMKGVYKEIDVAATPDGSCVAMVHSNNGCSELDAWVNMFGEFSSLIGTEADKSRIYDVLYRKAMNGDDDCGKVVAYNFLANEPVSGVKNGAPSYFRASQGKMNLANFFRAQLYATLATLKIGMDILVGGEKMSADSFNAHGGLFKVKGAAGKLLANVLNTKIYVSETASEGGAWGIALLAAYMLEGRGESLGDWLENEVFATAKKEAYEPDGDLTGFNQFFELYKSGLRAMQ